MKKGIKVSLLALLTLSFISVQYAQEVHRGEQPQGAQLLKAYINRSLYYKIPEILYPEGHKISYGDENLTSGIKNKVQSILETNQINIENIKIKKLHNHLKNKTLIVYATNACIFVDEERFGQLSSVVQEFLVMRAYCYGMRKGKIIATDYEKDYILKKGKEKSNSFLSSYILHKALGYVSSLSPVNTMLEPCRRTKDAIANSSVGQAINRIPFVRYIPMWHLLTPSIKMQQSKVNSKKELPITLRLAMHSHMQNALYRMGVINEKPDTMESPVTFSMALVYKSMRVKNSVDRLLNRPKKSAPSASIDKKSKDQTSLAKQALETCTSGISSLTSYAWHCLILPDLFAGIQDKLLTGKNIGCKVFQTVTWPLYKLKSIENKAISMIAKPLDTTWSFIAEKVFNINFTSRQCSIDKRVLLGKDMKYKQEILTFLKDELNRRRSQRQRYVAFLKEELPKIEHKLQTNKELTQEKIKELEELRSNRKKDIEICSHSFTVENSLEQQIKQLEDDFIEDGSIFLVNED